MGCWIVTVSQIDKGYKVVGSCHKIPGTAFFTFELCSFKKVICKVWIITIYNNTIFHVYQIIEKIFF